MKQPQVLERTQELAIEVIRRVAKLPKNEVNDYLGAELIKTVTRIGSNYRAADKKSYLSDFISSMKAVAENCDLALYWIELLIASGAVVEADICDVTREINQLMSYAGEAVKTSKGGEEGSTKTNHFLFS